LALFLGAHSDRASSHFKLSKNRLDTKRREARKPPSHLPIGQQLMTYPGDMATVMHISLEEFHARYAHESGYEYWFGKVVRKSVPTWLHAILQALLAEIFYEHGYFSGSELDLRISCDFQPRPDVAASLELESPGYPTKPIDIVAEILSPDDPPEKVLEKCQHYTELGIPQIYVFDPIQRSAAKWNRVNQLLEPITELSLTNGSVLFVDSIFARFDQRLKRRS
jgi:Uma2 family endonuclease